MDDIMDYISKCNLHAPTIEKITFPELLLADDLATGSFIINGLQKGIDQDRFKLMVYKKE
jgi:hypothetical protein